MAPFLPFALIVSMRFHVRFSQPSAAVKPSLRCSVSRTVLLLRLLPLTVILIMCQPGPILPLALPQRSE
eukprot:4328315-Prymnesium_polylepis.1